MPGESHSSAFEKTARKILVVNGIRPVKNPERLCFEKFGLVDLASAKEANKKLMKRAFRRIIVFEESGEDVLKCIFSNAPYVNAYLIGYDFGVEHA